MNRYECRIKEELSGKEFAERVEAETPEEARQKVLKKLEPYRASSEYTLLSVQTKTENIPERIETPFATQFRRRGSIGVVGGHIYRVVRNQREENGERVGEIHYKGKTVTVIRRNGEWQLT